MRRFYYIAVSGRSTDFRPPACFQMIHDPNVTGKEGSASFATQIITHKHPNLKSHPFFRSFHFSSPINLVSTGAAPF